MKKRIFITSILLLLCFFTLAAEKDLDKDITLVSFEQSWSDSHGTLSLKNNTDVVIKNVVFLITYTDMSGKEMDYKEYSKSINIAPGMTKKLDIDAYEHSRNFHYYKSKGLIGDKNTSFKIKFQIKDYNVYYNVYPNEINSSSSLGNMEIWIILILTILILGSFVGLFVLVAVMAKKRNRSAALWVALSLIATPLLMIIILLCIGKDERN